MREDEQIEILIRAGRKASRSKKEALKSLKKAGIVSKKGKLKKIYRGLQLLEEENIGGFIIQRLKDGKFFINTIPSLNLSGYGKTKKKANNMLKEAIDDLTQALSELKEDIN